MSRSQSSSAMAPSCRGAARPSTGAARRRGREPPFGAARAFDAGEGDGAAGPGVGEQGAPLPAARRRAAQSSRDEAAQDLAGEAARIEPPPRAVAAKALDGEVR